MKLTPSQEKAVEQLIDKFNNLLNTNKENKTVCFKAPTGSGKTFIAANFISKVKKIIENEKNRKIIFIIATLSSSSLPEQMKNKLDQYQQFLDNSFGSIWQKSPSSSDENESDYMIPDPETKIYNVIIFGKSSFGDNRILTERNLLTRYLQNLKNKNYYIVYIRDEAHYGLTSKGKDKTKIFENQIFNNADFVLHMTATPNLRQNYALVEIDENDLKEDWSKNIYLLKSKPIFNPDIKDVEDNIGLLKAAIRKFKQIKVDYQNDSKINLINPAMLIQLDNEPQKNLTNSKSELWKETLKQIEKTIKESGLSYCFQFSGNKTGSLKSDTNLKEISKNNGDYDVIIFKIGPATGWDIPRACMLVQLRGVNSTTLNQQTIGRIKRNCVPGLKFNKNVNNYYVYSNYQESSRLMFSYFLLGNYEHEKFSKIKVKKYFEDNEALVSDLNKFVKNEIKNKKQFIKNEIQRVFLKSNSNYLSWNPKKFIDSESKNVAYVSEEKIISLFEFEISMYELKQNKKIIYKLIKQTLKETYEKIFLNQKKQSYSQFLYVIFDNIFWSKIVKKYNKLKQNVILDNYNYELKEPNAVKTYIIWNNKGNEKNQPSFKNIKEKYMYRVNSSKDYYKYIQALDSNPEKIFMNKFIKDITKNKNQIYENLFLWAKLPVFNSDIYFEYWSDKSGEYGEYKKSFPDFVFKFRNFQIYVEVKAEADKDIDKNKTNEIINGYKMITENKALKNKTKNIIWIIARSYFYDSKKTTNERSYIDHAFCADEEIKKILEKYTGNRKKTVFELLSDLNDYKIQKDK